MIVQFVVTDNLPVPARTAVSLVQMALKVKRAVAERLIHDGAVQCQGRTVAQTHLQMRVGDELHIDYAPQPVVTHKKNAKKSMARFEVVHDDEHLIVVNKPAGLLTVPTPKRESQTLQSQIRKWLERQQPAAQAICVHRLDRGVSGLLVFAKSTHVADLIRDQFAARKPQRRYNAILQGNLLAAEGTIRSYLATDEALNRYSVADSEAGELAITHFTVKQRWRGVTLVEVRLETGRRNQIRVHMAEAGHPILGDPRYRPREAEHPLWPYKRLALHAETLGIMHPITQEMLQFSAPWPQEFRDLRRRLNSK
ncbi:MAG: RluA family pseudouridine synthase [Pirellulaceae bacterium]